MVIGGGSVYCGMGVNRCIFDSDNGLPMQWCVFFLSTPSIYQSGTSMNASIWEKRQEVTTCISYELARRRGLWLLPKAFRVGTSNLCLVMDGKRTKKAFFLYTVDNLYAHTGVIAHRREKKRKCVVSIYGVIFCFSHECLCS